MVLCPGCGSGMRFDPSKQMLYCDHCSNSIDPDTVNTPIDEATGSKTFEGTVYNCPQCGGQIFKDDNAAVTFCSYCGASLTLSGQLVKMGAPSSIIPFKQSIETAKENYKKYIKGALFAPSYLHEDAQVEKIRGIYMPYWIYGFNYDGDLTFNGSRSHRSGDYIITDHYTINQTVSIDYNGVGFDASSSFSDAYSDAIVPFKISDAKEFNAAYMCGFYADIADVAYKTYEFQARTAVAHDATRAILRTSSQYNYYHVQADPTSLMYKLNPNSASMSLFPVYFLANRHNDKVSYAVINGQTGKIAADIPISFVKYLIGSIILAIPIMIGLDLFVTLPIQGLGLVTSIFAIISFFISNGQMNRLYTREHHYDDLGLLTSQDMPIPTNPNPEVSNKNNVKRSNKFLTAALISFSLCFVLPFLLVLINAVELLALFPLLFASTFAFGILSSVSSSNPSSKANVKSPKKIVYRAPFKEKLSVVIKPILAVVISLLALLFHKYIYWDFLFYSIIVGVMVLVAVSFLDIVNIHNKLTQRLPSQFGARGGDENCEI